MTTGIEWTDDTWNPTRGCSRVSEGCRHCYAERVAVRFSGPGQPYEGLVKIRQRTGGQPYADGWSGVVKLAPEMLAKPLSWRKPRRVFVNSMSDLFHESLTNEQIAAVFGVMAACPQHTFQVLTKRAKRMREWFEWLRSSSEESFTMQQRGIVSAPNTARALLDAAYECLGKARKPELEAAWNALEHDPFPLPNVWLGVSVENQDAADERIPDLLQTPAAVRFLSVEPLIGPVDISFGIGQYIDKHGNWRQGTGLGWVIAGCESGPGARPCDVAWLRSLRDQCAAADVPFFLKQAVEDVQERCEHCKERVRAFVAGPGDGSWSCGCTTEGPEFGAAPDVGFGSGSKRKPGGIIGAPYLDGVQHLAFPLGGA